MEPLVWLAVAIVAGVVAYLVGWPAWEAYRARDSRESNRERYLAWRGRADCARPPPREGMTGERRRIYAGAALTILAVVALLAFFATS